ncbi:50S ribosomal protein L9 [Desulfurivibrio alkaliphilus]|uniref:Large ribosomal subunit protein bL9 n=1 Tax=Desulfurivibrio alkaliphilus (strain DSM 19089 / UNIQEM U267 / AHT2) TaxID=589865 RepID=D6Z2S3_DESAT|nr:50S ribosomal protein L9 [Desulfurivibrio alkaliphilus]ADH85848.1 ribosomal protein L9 [Desulfurivibrio alkaliphilus AHT 2]
MEVILKETIDTLGEIGDVVKVKPGYGRNYLIPQGKAELASKGNLAVLAKRQAAIAARKAEHRAAAEKLAATIKAAKITISQRTGEDNKLYGSVTSGDIATALAAQGVEVDKKKIMLEEPIKNLGTHTVPYKAGYQVTAEITVEVVPEESEQ